MTGAEGDARAAAEVIVVGAGPTGLMTALLLARRGHPVALVERWPRPYPLPRAIGMSHETMRALQNAELMDHVLPQLVFSADGSIGDETRSADGEFLDVIPFQATSLSGWPERAVFCQPELEEVLNAHVETHPQVQVLRGWELTTITQAESGTGGAVTVHALRTPEVEGGEPGPESLTVTGQYVVAADGAASTVRGTFDSEVVDLDCSSDWLVLDVIPHGEITVDPTFGQILPPPRSITLAISGHGRRRWEFLRNPDEAIDDLRTPEFAWAQLARWGVTRENAAIERQAVYTFHAAWSTRWRHGRVLLAGDAAHVMPPFLGEGMNSGVRDAMALSWQLDLVLRGLADPATLLDSYAAERSFHVRQLTEVAAFIAKDFTELDPQRATERDDRLRAERDGRVAKEPLPNWRLGPGTWDPDDEHAGYLGVQGRVEVDGTVGRFDDLVDRRRFVLIGRQDDPARRLPESLLARWAEIGGITAHFGPGSPVVDVDGTYDSWFTENGVGLVAFRPDFYVAATAASVDEAPKLVTALLERLGVRG